MGNLATPLPQERALRAPLAAAWGTAEADTAIRNGFGASFAFILTQSGDRTLVDRLFDFSAPLGERYVGAWEDASTFIIELVDVTGGALTITVVVTANATNYTDGDTVVVHMDMRVRGYVQSP